jgi:hypothetical protein
MEMFYKYVGIQGVLAVFLVIGYIFASVTGRTLATDYVALMFAVVGYYFAKNGVSMIGAVTNLLNSRKDDKK